MKVDRALMFLMSRGFSITYGIVMGLAFGAAGLFLVEERFAQLVWIFGSGIHTGIAFMWVISPSITAKWRREMQLEVDLMVARSLLEATKDVRRLAQTWSPTMVPPDDEPFRGRLQ